MLHSQSDEVKAKVARVSLEDRRELVRRSLEARINSFSDELHHEPWVDEDGLHHPAYTDEEGLEMIEDDLRSVAMHPQVNPRSLEEWWDELWHFWSGEQRRPSYRPHAACWRANL